MKEDVGGAVTFIAEVVEGSVEVVGIVVVVVVVVEVVGINVVFFISQQHFSSFLCFVWPLGQMPSSTGPYSLTISQSMPLVSCGQGSHSNLSVDEIRLKIKNKSI